MRIVGRANYLNCAPVGEFFNQFINGTTQTLKIDFAECLGMDSTFLGLLAGTAMRLKKRVVPGKIIVQNLSQRNLDLIQNLGIRSLLEVTENVLPDNATAPDQSPLDGPHSSVDRQAMIQAHEQLIAANPENASRFQDIVDYLRKRAKS